MDLHSLKIASFLAITVKQVNKKSVPDLTPERDQLNQDQSHVHDLLLTAISPAVKAFL
jgi:hypothetical protein